VTFTSAVKHKTARLATLPGGLNCSFGHVWVHHWSYRPVIPLQT